MASRTGYIKKSELQLFKNLRRIGLRALVIEEDDDLIGAAISQNGDEILLSTKLGMACRFDQNDDQIRPMGRTARGVTGMRFKLPGDEVVSLEIIREHSYDEPESMTDAEADDMDNLNESIEAEEDISSTGPEVLVVTTGGMGKRSCVSTYRKTNRGARGVVNIRLRENETVLGVVQVTDEDELMMTTERGQLVRIPVHEIRRVGRAAKGVIIMRLNDGDRITGISKVAASEEKASENNAAENAPQTEAPAPQEAPAAENQNTEQTPEQE
jgi:DNA gyrase subunit A